MSLIDQRILVVAPVETVWAYVAEPAMLARWHRGCKQVSALTTRTTGQGTRRRCVGENGKAVVEEIAAWFEHIGYEYVVVDGPYREFRGRFRLQAVPEGTIVNWTVEYQLRGLLSGVRNVVSFRRQYEDMMADSLRQLRRVVEASGVRLDPEQHARFAMQSAPSVEVRAARSAEPSTQPGVPKGTPAPHAAMRPVAVGDDDLPDLPVPVNVSPPTVMRTPPTPPESEALPPPPPWAGLSKITEPPVDEEDTKPRPSTGLSEALARQRKFAEEPVEPASKPPVEEDSRAPFAPTVPISLVAPPRPPEPELDTQTMDIKPPPTPRFPMPLSERVPSTRPSEPNRSVQPPVEPPHSEPKRPSSGRMPAIQPPTPAAPPPVSEPKRPSSGRMAAIPPTPPVESSRPLVEPKRATGDTTPQVPIPDKPDAQVVPQAGQKAPPTDIRDTGEMSIWDVFGVSRPSERTQAELEAAISSLLTPVTPPSNPGATTKAASQRAAARKPSRRAKIPVRHWHKPQGRYKTSVRFRKAR
ncbi:MAG: SRPBCC family protein [Anaerolineae bacterium]|nr:SRPBCC family protein [Anaerolineae bacterium]